MIPEIASTFWAVIVGELVSSTLRGTGKLRATPTGNPEVVVNGIALPHDQTGTESMSGYDIVGDDNYGFIGWDSLIGAMNDSDFLDALVEGSAADFLVSGDGSSEIIGAAKAAGGRAQAAKKAAALKTLAMRNAGAVINRGLDRRRRYPLGFVPTAVAAATTVQIPSAPQNLYRPERLVIPSDIAFDAGVADIKVGNQSQLVQSVEVPAALFSEVAINTGVTFDTAEVGNQVSVNIRNKSASAFEFTAGLVGTIAK